MTADQELIHRYLEDPASLGEADLEQLIVYLRAEPHKAIELREQLMIDDLLGQKLALDRKNFLAQVEQRLADFERGEEEVYNQVSDLRAIAEAEIERSPRPPGISPWIKFAGSVSLAAVVVACVLVWQFQQSGPRPVANVEELSGQVVCLKGEQQTSLRLGQALSTGDSLVASPGSTLVWKYKDGTTVRILGETTTRLSADANLAKQVKLERGELVASVAKQTRGPMVFTTPHATATVRGTELRLTVGEANTQLDVTEGIVELQRAAGGRVLQLAANESVIATADKLQPRELTWPMNRGAVVFLFKGLDKRQLARNPDTGNLKDVSMEEPSERPEAAAGEKHRVGIYRSEEAGKLVLPLLKRSGQFSLDIIFTATKGGNSQPAVLCSLGPVGNESFVLIQAGEQLQMRLQGKIGMPPGEIDLGAVTPGAQHYVTFAFQEDGISAFVDGVEVAVSSDLQDTVDGWDEGPLVLGADAAGKRPWQGKIAGFAIYDQYLEKPQADANRQRFKQLRR